MVARAMDWLDDLEERNKDKRATEKTAAQKAALILENVSGLWRAFRKALESETERYNQRFPNKPIAKKNAPGGFSEFLVNTVGRYPSVNLSVRCCGDDGRQFCYTYTVRRNYDVENQTSDGRFIIASNGEDAFLSTPDGLLIADPTEAAVLLLRGVADPSAIAQG
jgi:hypothetical protein